MNVIFLDKGIEDLYLHGATSDRRYKKFIKDSVFLESLVRVINELRKAPTIDTLRQISYLHYEKLKHIDASSVRIRNGRVERLIFRENNIFIEVSLIEIDMNHYGKKK